MATTAARVVAGRVWRRTLIEAHRLSGTVLVTGGRRRRNPTSTTNNQLV